MSIIDDFRYRQGKFKKIEPMNIVKAIIKQIWPIIFTVLEKAAAKTDTPFDDIALAGVNAALYEWLEDTEEDVIIEK